MRYHSLRFDVWVCLAVCVLLSIGASKILTPIFNKNYEKHKIAHEVLENEIGGVATESIFRAESIEDLLSHDTFTIVYKNKSYSTKGGGYYKNFYLQALELPSGEIVAARINGKSVVRTGENSFSGDAIMPVGKIVKEDLTSNETFLEQIEYSYSLDRTDFYIDMVGNAAIESEESFIEAPIMLIQILIVIITFPICHYFGSKYGIFPYFFEPKSKE